jgi:hypothetical protein
MLTTRQAGNAFLLAPRHTRSAPTSHAKAKTEVTITPFDAAFLRLQERYDPLAKDHFYDLNNAEKEALFLLEDDRDELLRQDQEILREHALARGIDIGRDFYKRRAPVVYMAHLLLKPGYGNLEDVYREYPHLRKTPQGIGRL